MKKILSKVFLLIAVPFLKLSHYFSPNRTKKNTKQHERVKAWYADNGDATLRIDYPLNKKSLVFDVGGYEGNWASEIYCKYGSEIYIFEPVSTFYCKINSRFSENEHVQLFNFGLGGKNEQIKIGISQDASSIYKTSQNFHQEISIIDISDFIIERGITKIDLMKINIEGGEYDLLDSLIQSGLHKIVDNFQIQFHDFVPNAEARMKKIHEGLQKSHKLTYQYQFVWENWKALTK